MTRVNKVISTDFLNGKTVLVTGGTGTFGRAFVARLLAVPGVAKVIIFSRDELKQSEMQAQYKDEPRLRFFIGDIRNTERLKRAFDGVDIVVHAAAMKRVESIEYNPTEAIETNIIGSRNVIDAALDRNVGKVLFVSSDKAVEPINLYGATKLAAEKLFVAANAYVGQGVGRFSVVRYGNVIGSRGSFVEMISRQRESGTITVTNKEMTRFWIRIESVMDIVLECLLLMQGGEIFVPKMKNMAITDMVKLLAPECTMRVIGTRPGEKLHEILITRYEAVQARELPHMYAIAPMGGAEWLARYRCVPKGFLYTSNNKKFLLKKKEAAQLFG
ncbi:UDP-N-acetylglucosamine 4,6-dehydratase (inverting) [Candidatus Adlerbacteria bacterium RIFCSPHIGHO2_02_FULL_54_18]|uniref:UDP-N-acetylglucosamine 4,6-dehydratase (Inverting) n=2 Tax=Candidatus Adleribacteriota TaxID=1752736 RepID=A0A1F4Y2D1_9BACT|nr:MAG: UDP-N-acetylglucosamine 4,6-dehydratase (inverting) [Candidatus Adlerbacteria bacterium RIFCSPLOWO2_01_FULL_54_21b]OGC88008.1 MAG: UDP-N-acetylglucosamine 4,6-dehydratase (inverting) [Candidatus Adlerbacteria bacterium RIFCSPHIGHO2_02_FULL_54_18]